MTKNEVAFYIQNHELLEKFFISINKELIRRIMQKLDNGFYPESISMNDDGYIMVDNHIVSLVTFSKKQLAWFGSIKNKYVGGYLASFSLVGCINRLKKLKEGSQ